MIKDLSPKFAQLMLKELLSYNPCTGLFHWKITGVVRPRIQVGKQAGFLKRDGYIQIGIYKEVHYAHRLAWFYIYGRWPNEIDHIDGNKANNSMWNLREVTHSENLKHYYRLKESPDATTS